MHQEECMKNIKCASLVRLSIILLAVSATAQDQVKSSSGTTIAIWGPEDKKTIRLIDAKTMKLKFTLSGHERDVETAIFSPDSKTLASAEGNVFERNAPKAKIKIWSAETGELKYTLLATRWGVCSMAFSPDGKRLASGHAELAGSPPQVILWDVQTGKEVARDQSGGFAFGLAFSPDGKLLAGGSVGGVHGYDTTLELVLLWDAETLEPKRRLAAGFGRSLPIVRGNLFSPDGKTLINPWGQWDVETGKLKSEAKKPQD
jgi:WD40 repeat protein